MNSGKVHGSLARAGKVRGQTPKVAKQDKKKKPRGRAHKRMQYNRRFVTAGNFSTLVLNICCFKLWRSWISCFQIELGFWFCVWFFLLVVVGFGKKRGPNSSEKWGGCIVEGFLIRLQNVLFIFIFKRWKSFDWVTIEFLTIFKWKSSFCSS